MKIRSFLQCLVLAGISVPAMALSPLYEPATAEFVVQSEWGSDNYCGEIRVTAVHEEQRDWRVHATVNGTVWHVWNGRLEPSDDEVYNSVFHPADWNAILPIGGTTSIGLCGAGDKPTNLFVGMGSRLPDPYVGRSLDIIDLDSGALSQEQTSHHYRVVNTAEELAALQDLVWGPLDVDLNTQTVIGAFMGPRNTGGYSIEVTQATETESEVNLRVVLQSPGRGCGVSTAITYPYHVVAIDKVHKPVGVIEVDEVINCELMR